MSISHKEHNVVVEAHETELLNNAFYDVIKMNCGKAKLIETYYDYKDLSKEVLNDNCYCLDYRDISEKQLDLYVYSKHFQQRAKQIIIYFKQATIFLPRKLFEAFHHFVIEVKEQFVEGNYQYSILLINPRYTNSSKKLLLRKNPIEVSVNESVINNTKKLNTYYLSTKKKKLLSERLDKKLMKNNNKTTIQLDHFNHFGILIEIPIKKSKCEHTHKVFNKSSSLENCFKTIGLGIFLIFSIFLFVKK